MQEMKKKEDERRKSCVLYLMSCTLCHAFYNLCPVLYPVSCVLCPLICVMCLFICVLCPVSCVMCPLFDELLLRIFLSVLQQLVSINGLLLTTHLIRMHNRVAITLRLRVRRNFLRRFSRRITGKRAGDSPVKSPQMNLSRVLNVGQ